MSADVQYIRISTVRSRSVDGGVRGEMVDCMHRIRALKHCRAGDGFSKIIQSPRQKFEVEI